MFRQLILMYFNNYILFSLIIFIFYLVSGKFIIVDFDVNEKLKEVYENLEKIRLKNETIANFLENFINIILEGDKVRTYMMFFILCLIPFIRILFLFSAILNIIGYFKSNS